MSAAASVSHKKTPSEPSAAVLSLPQEMVPPLLYWYQSAARDLPWRHGKDPYRIWISEIMLQQTRVEAVRPYYERFLSAFPTVFSLAEADDDLLMKLWEGLGYYSRARNLKKAAVQLVSLYGGVFPETPGELIRLPGIGSYTAGAISSIAFGKPSPAVDGNVLRVVTRLADDRRDIGNDPVKSEVREALRDIYPLDPDGASAMTQALMELGALVCLPGRAAKCDFCPLAFLCRAKAGGNVSSLPVKAPKKPRKTIPYTVVLMEADGKIALCKRPDSGLLAGLWGFPMLPGKASRDEVLRFAKDAGIPVNEVSALGEATHVFTHLTWEMTGWHIFCASCVLPDSFTWVSRTALISDYAIPSAFSKYLKIITEKS